MKLVPQNRNAKKTENAKKSILRHPEDEDQTLSGKKMRAQSALKLTRQLR